MTKTENYTQFGPQHPAAHGVLRLVLELDGEIVERADPHIGLFIEELKNLLKIKLIFKLCPILIGLIMFHQCVKNMLMHWRLKSYYK